MIARGHEPLCGRKYVDPLVFDQACGSGRLKNHRALDACHERGGGWLKTSVVW